MTEKEKNAHAVALGRRGGKVVTPAKREHLARIASLGAQSRWAATKPVNEQPAVRDGLEQVRVKSLVAGYLAQAQSAIEQAIALVPWGRQGQRLRRALQLLTHQKENR